ncbi:RNA-directed DNA polymerase, eukaryota, partial [Tanacetum coccineum]
MNRQNIGGRNVAALDVMVSEIGHVYFNNHPDAWSWKISDSDSLSVQATRSHIDNCLLSSLSPSSRWSKLIPRKVNVFIWWLILDRLPTRLNSSLRGIEISSIACPSCNADMESNDHVFFECDTTSNIWRLVRTWTSTNMPSFPSSSDWLQWFENWSASKESKDRMYVISAASLWVLWRYRNNVTFNDHPTRGSDLFDNI